MYVSVSVWVRKSTDVFQNDKKITIKINDVQSIKEQRHWQHKTMWFAVADWIYKVLTFKTCTHQTKSLWLFKNMICFSISIRFTWFVPSFRTKNTNLQHAARRTNNALPLWYEMICVSWLYCCYCCYRWCCSVALTIKFNFHLSSLVRQRELSAFYSYSPSYTLNAPILQHIRPIDRKFVTMLFNSFSAKNQINEMQIENKKEKWMKRKIKMNKLTENLA